MLKRLVLFDIDGTLIWSAGAGRSAIARALVAEMGMTGPIENYHFDGKTDPQIVMELLLAAGHPDAQSETHVQAVCRRYLEVLTHELQTRKGSIRAYPGVVELLAALEQRRDVLVGLLTGNIAEGASQKLTAAGIEMSRFRVGAYGSDAADRAELPPIAAARAAPLMGRIPDGEEIIIIGDTPADMTCGTGVHARAIGVATGRHSVVELLAAGAHVAFDSLLDTASVLDAIYS
ncbi:MAG: HAD family hydrolase [Gemmatimonadota bacterium]|nr:HAD family hydrolase [Gemmatimonadota bacterium]